MKILLLKMPESVFNRSIWQGLSQAWTSLGHTVDERDVHASTEPGHEIPDILFAVHGGTVPRAVIDHYRLAGVVTAVYLLDEPYEVDRSVSWSRYYDFAFTVDRATVSRHARDASSSFLPLAYDASRFHPGGRAYQSEILVLGSPFEHRLQLLAPLRSRWGRHITWVGPGWQPFCPEGRHVEQLVSADVCARFYRGASFVINIHRDSLWSHYGDTNASRIQATHLNPRFWEAAACGAFQLCSYRADLDPFKDVVKSFETADELHGLLERYWDDADERRALSSGAQAMMAGHSYQARAQEVLRRLGPAIDATLETERLQPMGKENPLGDDK